MALRLFDDVERMTANTFCILHGCGLVCKAKDGLQSAGVSWLHMAAGAGWYAGELRRELGERNGLWARGRAHVESYGDPPVIVYSPEELRHGNFLDASYAAIAARPEWMRRFDKIHAQGRSLPKAESGRRWRELDSSMSSDALLMNVFCAPGVADEVGRALGVEGDGLPEFGWKARVPLASGRFDRTEVDMRWGDLLVEAKLTENDFQTRAARIVEGYRDFDAVFERELLPRVALRETRRRTAVEFAEEFTQEWEGEVGEDPIPSGAEARVFDAEGMYGLKPVPSATKPVPFTTKPVPSTESIHLREEIAREFQQGIVARAREAEPAEPAYTGYQLIRNVLAAYAEECSFCVLHDERRPDLREAWFAVMAAVKPVEMRARCKVLTWQELARWLPDELQEFLDLKYGIATCGGADAR
jgi:hypothetical protein